MSKDYQSWSISKLKQEIKAIEKVINRKQNSEKKAVLTRIRKLARDSGFELGELVPSGSASGGQSKKASSGRKKTAVKKRKAKTVKFRSKTDPELTWAGSGRKPKWLLEYENSGGKLEDLAE